METAYNAMSKSEQRGLRPATDFFDRPRLDGWRGSCLRLLNEPRAAQTILTGVLARRHPSNVKGRSLVKLELAASFLQEREPEEACELIADALAIPPEVRVGPILSSARRLLAELHSWADTRAVKDLRDQLPQLGLG
jgi:hypothetical protein